MAHSMQKRKGSLAQNAGVAVAGMSHRHRGRLREREHGHPPHKGGGTLQTNLLHGPTASCYRQTMRQLCPAALQLQHYPQGRHRLKRTCRKAAAPRPKGLLRRAAQWRSGDGRRFLHLRHCHYRLHSLAAAVAEGPIPAAEPPPLVLLMMNPAAAEAVLTLLAGLLPLQAAVLPPAAPLQLYLKLKGATKDL